MISSLARRCTSRAAIGIAHRRLASTAARDACDSIASAAGRTPDPNPPRYPPANTKYLNLKISRPLAASLALVVAGIAAGIAFPPELQVAYHPPSTDPQPPRNPAAHAEHSPRQLERELAALPVVAQLRHDAFEKRESDLWTETRSFQTQEARHAHNLIASALLGREKLAIAPLVRERKDGSASVVVLHVGNDVCGHPGVVHGGLVATLFDQYLARLGFMSMSGKVTATAHLSVDYRAPVRANQFLVLRLRRETTLEELARKPHKVTVVGRLEDANGKLLAESRGIFVQPRDAVKFLKVES